MLPSGPARPVAAEHTAAHQARRRRGGEEAPRRRCGNTSCTPRGSRCGNDERGDTGSLAGPSPPSGSRGVPLDDATGSLRLWEVLGSPVASERLPPRVSRQWAHAGALLNHSLAGTGLPRIRSPAALWRLLHASSPPPLATWELLCQNFVLRDLVNPLRNFSRFSAPPLFCWNARHIRSIRTPNNQEKRNVLF